MFNEAARAYKQAVGLDPSAVESWYQLGRCFHTLGDKTASVQCYMTAVRLEPSHHLSLNALGAVLKEKARPLEAMLCFEEAVHVSSSFAAAHSNLASLIREHQPSLIHLAVRRYLAAIRFDPTLDAYFNLSNRRKAAKEAPHLSEKGRALYKSRMVGKKLREQMRSENKEAAERAEEGVLKNARENGVKNGAASPRSNPRPPALAPPTPDSTQHRCTPHTHTHTPRPSVTMPFRIILFCR